MANNVGSGNKFTAVNLNRSYGHHHHHHSSSFESGRARSGGGGGGGGGGMVVLSRPRSGSSSSQKKAAVPKLSVPAPVNLPSLRKEHEWFDSLRFGTGGGAGGGSGNEPNRGSSGAGWTKPAAVLVQDKDKEGSSNVGSNHAIGSSGNDHGDRGLSGVVAGINEGNDGSANKSHSNRLAGAMASGPSSRGYPMAEKVTVLRGEDFPSLQAALPTISGSEKKQKDDLNQKQKQFLNEELPSGLRDNFNMKVSIDTRLLLQSRNNVSSGSDEKNGENRRFGSSIVSEKERKQADCSQGPFPLFRLNPRSDWADDERDTRLGLTSRGRDHGFTKSEAYWDRDIDFPRPSVLPQKQAHLFDRWVHHDSDTGKFSSIEATKLDTYGRDVRTPSREGLEGNSWRVSSPAGNERNNFGARTYSLSKETTQETKYMRAPSRGNAQVDSERIDMGFGQSGRQPLSNSQVHELNREYHGNELHNRWRGEIYQSSSVSKSSLALNGKGIRVSDPILNFGRGVSLFSKSKKPYLEDPFIEDFGAIGFDGRDSFSGGVGLLKKKKDVLKQANFRDPVRESFEAELERVQKMQEQERQGMIKEQERLMEQARIEEEERMRLAREQEEYQRKLEKEVKEAAYRAEQEQLEAKRRAEEKRIHREEEKRRMLMEEERRKQAAKQKLLELEEKIAKRKAEAEMANTDNSFGVTEKMLGMITEKDLSKVTDAGDWGGRERMERITTSASSDSSGMNRSFEMDSRAHFSRDQSRSHGNLYPSYQERIYQNEADELYSFGRSRYSMRHPHVFPPPSLTSMHRSSHKGENEYPASSAFLENRIQYNHGENNDSAIQRSFESCHQGNASQTEVINAQEENSENEAQKVDKSTTRCYSQSSVSISSPPSSPVYLSHDDLDESGDSPILSSGERKDASFVVQGNESIALPSENKEDNVMSGSSIISASDDEEWTTKNDDEFQEQEEYDEDDDGYEEQDEVHDGEDENNNLTQKFEDIDLEEKGPLDMMENLVLGFNEGVEVGILNDEFEKSSRNEETELFAPQISIGTSEEQQSFDVLCNDEPTLQPASCSPKLSIDNSSKIFEETEKAMHDFAIQPKISPQTLAVTEVSGHVSGSSNPGLSTQPQVPSPVGQIVMSGQPELPVKLQFGLFTSPSLIPSPVPAIQIGSIQMPLPLHPPFGQSGTHMHPSQPPLFQFGQLRYTSPISQGMLPLAPQPMSFVQNNVSTNYSLNPNVGGPRSVQHVQDSCAHDVTKSEVLSILTDGQPGLLPQHLDLAHGTVSKEGNVLPSKESEDKLVKIREGQGNLSHIGDNNLRTESGFWKRDSFMKNLTPLPTEGLQGQRQTGPTISQSITKKDFNASKGQGVVSGSRRKKNVYTAKNSVPRSSFQAYESARLYSRGFQKRPRSQRVEFRVRENDDKRQSDGLVSSKSYGVDDKSNVGVMVSGGRTGFRKQIFEHEESSSLPISSQDKASRSRNKKGGDKEYLRKSQNISSLGEDVDVPLQSGVVQVFEQHGIEAPSDDDDFIEVRSKRQMLNDRREKREKEIKAKHRVSKMLRKLHSPSQSAISDINSQKNSASVVKASNNIQSDSLATDGNGRTSVEASTGFSTPTSSQHLPVIGHANKKVDVLTDTGSQPIKPFQKSSLPVVSGGGKNLASGSIFESKNTVLENVQTALGSWGNSQINQQIHVDEAMKPKHLDPHSSVGDTTNLVSKPIASVAISMKETSFSPSTSPINSLLAGERIQFGAVTSPTILPPNNRAISHGIGPPGPCPSDIQIPHNLSASDSGCSIFYNVEKHTDKSCAHLTDSEAEAAASAVAVAAISNDEIIGNMPSASSIATAESKSFGSADIDGLSGDQQFISRSRAEESLSVTLPTDLSIETPPISLWPPLPSPQNSPSQMLSHVTGGQSSHFPFYEMNPMFGGPVFTFGPHNDSTSTQSQPQKSSAPVSSSHGIWQTHSGIDSFYGPPGGFPGPFINPHGITGVQGPPHMVIYNHFAPVGQFGQVGLSFMGTTFVPSGKQPDWKHNPASSTIGAREGDSSNLNMVSTQGNPANKHAPIQHLAPGSSHLPMTSPLAMFEASPFQSPEMSIQARWPHIPTSHLQSTPVSMPLQQQGGGVLPSQLNCEPQVDQPLTANRFPETQMSTSSDNSQSISVATDASIPQLPDELGLVDSSNSLSVGATTQSITTMSSSSRTIPDASGKTNVMQNGRRSNNNYQNTSSGFKTQPSHLKNASSQQYSNPSGYNYQRGSGISQKNSSRGEWFYRRAGYQGRNQSLGTEKSYLTSKTKQIYVAKHTTGTSKE